MNLLSRFKEFLKGAIKGEDGVTAIEYALIALAVVVTGLAVIGTIGTQINTTFTTILNKL